MNIKSKESGFLKTTMVVNEQGDYYWIKKFSFLPKRKKITIFKDDLELATLRDKRPHFIQILLSIPLIDIITCLLVVFINLFLRIKIKLGIIYSILINDHEVGEIFEDKHIIYMTYFEDTFITYHKCTGKDQLHHVFKSDVQIGLIRKNPVIINGKNEFFGLFESDSYILRYLILMVFIHQISETSDILFGKETKYVWNKVKVPRHLTLNDQFKPKD